MRSKSPSPSAKSSPSAELLRRKTLLKKQAELSTTVSDVPPPKMPVESESLKNILR